MLTFIYLAVCVAVTLRLTAAVCGVTAEGSVTWPVLMEQPPSALMDEPPAQEYSPDRKTPALL